jgi:hypothetical protein
MQEMMNQMGGPNGAPPNMDSLMGNKNMISMMFGMLKSNPAMIKMITQQLGPNHPASGYLNNMSDKQLLTMVTWFERIFKVFSFLWPVLKIVKNNFRTLAVLFIAYIVYRFFL